MMNDALKDLRKHEYEVLLEAEKGNKSRTVCVAASGCSDGRSGCEVSVSATRLFRCGGVAEDSEKVALRNWEALLAQERLDRSKGNLAMWTFGIIRLASRSYAVPISSSSPCLARPSLSMQ